jgi:adenine-specific DNA methylase
MPLADGSVDLVVTDPPYFDSVQYGNLSMFFRVWLRQFVGEEATGDIRWSYPLSESAVDSSDNAEDHYVETMSAIFAESRRVMKPGTGRLAFSFHHWKAAGWASICVALKRSGFQLEDYYIVHSENPISVHIANMNALTDDAILVLIPGRPAIARAWRQPATITTATSAEFCRDCAQGVGWVLAGELSEAEILAWWAAQLGAHAGRESKNPPKSKR